MSQKGLNRRNFLKASALTSLSLTLPEISFAGRGGGVRMQYSRLNNESRMPGSEDEWKRYLQSHRVPYDGLVTSLKQELRYTCQVRGQLPRDLQGSLFRSGPGLFERAGMRRRMQIDADGMIRQFKFINGQVVFSNKHVRTKKFVDEEKAGKYIYPSFGMQVPRYNLMFTNSVARIQNQASVCAFVFGRKLFVTDEIQPLTQIDMRDLRTIGEVTVGGEKAKFMAHYRITHFGRKKLHLASFDPMSGSVQVLTYDEQFKCIERSRSVKVSRSFHDWHATEDYFVFLLPPLYMSTGGLAQALAGISTIADAVEFRKNEKAQVLIIPRDGREARILTLPDTLDSWHSINAYQTSPHEIMYDFVASTRRASVASNKSVMTKIMRGEVIQNGTLRDTGVYRALLNYNRKHVTYGRDYYQLRGVEMPTVDARLYGKPYDNAYFIAGQEAIDTKLVRLNVKNGQRDEYDFGPNRFVTEPIFAPSSDPAKGYLLSEVYSYNEKKSYLAVLDASHLRRGPIAEVWLNHHLPIGFHGFWQGT